MKQNHKRTNRTHNRPAYCPPYPNAAEPEYFTKKALELLAAGVSSCCVVFAMLSLLLIS